MEPRSHSEEYYNSPENGMFPMSQLDCEILDELEKLLKEIDLSGKIYHVFKSYKRKLEDRSILENLKDLNSNIDSIFINTKSSSSGGGDEDERRYPHFVIQDIQIPARLVKTIKKEDRYHPSKHKMVYYLIINYNSDYEGPIINIEIPFNTDRHREKTLSSLREHMIEHCKIDILIID